MLKHMTMAVALGVIGLPGQSAAQDWKSLLKDDLQKWSSGGGGDLFRANNGTLIVDGTGQVTYTGSGRPLDLRNFELRAEVLTRAGGRAGLAFHLSGKDPRASGGLEVRLDNSYSRSRAGQSLLKTGSLVWLRPVVKSVVPDDRWFLLRISVRAPRVQVWVDKQLLVDYLEPEKLEMGRRLRRGTFAVRGHGGSGAVLIRNLQVKPLPEGKPAVPAKKLDDTDLRLAELHEQAFPLVDFHIRLQGGLTLQDVVVRAHETGINAGTAVNCGQGLPIGGDKAALAFLKTAEGRPMFAGMQAEGREWMRLFAPATVARFDYVCTDAMTVTDGRGRRTRLWIKEEVDIPDPQAFMELLVKAIEGILDREPIDFYANPTYLPAAIAKNYDRLWTPERMHRVVDALAKNRVALEINDSLRLPKPALIKMAKEAGVKFAFGTNNSGRELGRLEYCLRMIEECALAPDDLWAPKADGQKPIQVRKRQ